jgi:nicotinamide-nucleotide amidase
MNETGDIRAVSKEFIALCTARKLKVATAESCTGGLIAAALTEVPGSSVVVDRGFVTYSNESKTEMLGVDAALIADVGAVSAEVAQAMVQGAIARSDADLAVAVTGIAGPDGGTTEKPVGLVHLAAMRRGGAPVHAEHRFGDIGRAAIRLATVREAIAMLTERVSR